MKIFSIRSKLTLSFLIILIISILTIILYYINIKSLNKNVDALKNDIPKLISLSQQVSNQTYVVLQGAIKYRNSSDSSEKSELNESINTSIATTDKYYNDLLETLKNANLKSDFEDNLDKLNTSRTSFYDEIEKYKTGEDNIDKMFQEGGLLNNNCEAFSNRLSTTVKGKT